MHLGNAWAFLLAWLAARRAGGRVVLRIEDIDPARSRQEFVDGILRDLTWLGLDWDEGPDCGGAYGPYLQSQRFAWYEEALERLASAGFVYPCFCTRKELRTLASAPHGPVEAAYPGTCRSLDKRLADEKLRAGARASLRFHAPLPPDAFCDLIAGPFPKNGSPRADDGALRRSDGVFSYLLAVVVDDAAMNITQVVRGNDLMHGTPQQIQLFHALGAHAPDYAHIPILCDNEGERLAKRHASMELRALRELGVTAAAVVGYLAWLGGLIPAPEPTTPEQLVEVFEFCLLKEDVLLLEKSFIKKLLQISN